MWPGRSATRSGAGTSSIEDAGRHDRALGLSRRLRIAFGKLGPTYIKLGQILSSGEGIFPPELVSRVHACCATASRRSHSTTCAASSRPSSAGRCEGIFAEFDRTPIAAASIAQVHGARLRTGEEVVVKVQRPDVAELVRRDLAVHELLRPASRRADPGRRRSPTRRRSSSCSPRRSSRSSTSASRPRTCSTSAASSQRPTSARSSSPAPIHGS